MKRKLLTVIGYIALGALLVVSYGIVGRNDYEMEKEQGFRSLEEF